MRTAQLLRCLNNKARERSRRRVWVEGCVCFLSWGILCWCAVVADAFCFLPENVRWFLWGGLCAGLAGALARCGYLLLAPRDLRECALAMERARPALRDCVINSLEFIRNGRVGWADRILKELPFSPDEISPDEISPVRAGSLLWLLMAFFLLWTGGFVASPQGMCHSLVRIAWPSCGMAPYGVPEIAEVLPGDVMLPKGQDLCVKAGLTGKTPARCVLQFESGSRRECIGMNALPEGGFSCVVPCVYESGRYRIAVPRRHSRWYAVKIHSAPEITDWSMELDPPAYTGKAKQVFLNGRKAPKTAAVPDGTVLKAEWTSSVPVASAVLAYGGKTGEDVKCEGCRLRYSGKLQAGQGRCVLSMRNAFDVEGVWSVPVEVVPDMPPSVMLAGHGRAMQVARGKTVALEFSGKDDYGIVRVGVEAEWTRGTDTSKTDLLQTEVPQENPKEYAGRFLVETDVAVFPADVSAVRLRIWMEDNAPARHRGYSETMAVSFTDGEKPLPADASLLQEMIRKQRFLLGQTNHFRMDRLAGRMPAAAEMDGWSQGQASLRADGARLLEEQRGGMLAGESAGRLESLLNQEMRLAVEQSQAALRSGEADIAMRLQALGKTQNAILAGLESLLAQLPAEQETARRQELFAMLEELIRRQRGVLSSEGQDEVAKGILRFCRRCAMEELSPDEFGKTAQEAGRCLEENGAYEHAVAAAEIWQEDGKEASEGERGLVMKALMKALDLLNRWRVAHAKKTVEDAAKVLKALGEELDAMEKRQAHIAEVTRGMLKNPDLTEADREKLAEMDREQKAMADMIEKLANDLSQFPELPVCNELNGKMREMYEDVLQALDSDMLPSVEIAVQKEDSFLDSIRKTKERVEDVEMWLPDVPDHFVWNMESFDADEFPDMTLVPLPDELEDIVGELLEQESRIDEQSQDTTGNNFLSDAQEGWAVMDGPIATFSAKGKSGNTRPNDNEQTGRSGAGREGQAIGELVENHVAGLEGRETHARKTNDALQKGQVTEDEDSTLKARATGGGKLGGESESEGMHGQAPRRDLGTADHGKSQRELRQQTEALYASARLLYLQGGRLGEAAKTMRVMEQAGDVPDLNRLRKRVMRLLDDSRVQIGEGAVLPVNLLPVQEEVRGTATDEENLEKLPEEYREMLKQYYRRLQEER